MTPAETCFRTQTPGCGLFWRPPFPKDPSFPDQRTVVASGCGVCGPVWCQSQQFLRLSSGAWRGEGLKPLGFVYLRRSPHHPAPRAEVPKVRALHRRAPEVRGRRQLQVSAHSPSRPSTHRMHACRTRPLVPPGPQWCRPPQAPRPLGPQVLRRVFGELRSLALPDCVGSVGLDCRPRKVQAPALTSDSWCCVGGQLSGRISGPANRVLQEPVS